MAGSALALLPDSFITGLKDASAFEKFKEASEMPKVILASTKSRATPLYKSLSLSFKGRLAFALVSFPLFKGFNHHPRIVLLLLSQKGHRARKAALQIQGFARAATSLTKMQDETRMHVLHAIRMWGDGVSCYAGEGL